MKVLTERGTEDRVMPDLAQMRVRLFTAKPAAGPSDVRQGPGRLQDIDLLAQACALRAGDPARTTLAQLRAGKRAGVLSGAAADRLTSIWRGFWRLHASSRLLTDRPLDMDDIGRGAQDFLLREVDAPDIQTVLDRIRDNVAEAEALIMAEMPPEDHPLA